MSEVDPIKFLVGGRPIVTVTPSGEVDITANLSPDELLAAIRILAPIAARYLATTTLVSEVPHG